MQKIKNHSKKAFSLVELIVSLSIFAFIFSIVIGITLALTRSQSKVQAQLFLTQSAQNTIELMSRQLRFGYSYSGSTLQSYQASNYGQTITLNARESAIGSISFASSSQILTNAADSPFILFEGQAGDPTIFTDQVAFCYANNNLYRVTNFNVQTNNKTYFKKCDEGDPILPESIKLDYISFDVYGDSSESPRNPMVRIKMRLSHEEGGYLEIQTTVTQRLITYF
jgi:prepilin-type N-terminal cleavage/methylation domain-containing protein